MRALWIPEAYSAEVRREGFTPVDNLSVMLTHVSETIRNNLPQLLSYKDTRALLDRLDPEYKRLLEEICPAQISYSGLQAVLKALLAERVSIRNLHLILEAIAEIVPHARRTEQIAAHVRMRIAQQICGDLADGGPLNVLRLGNRWDLAFHQSLKRDGKGEVIEFDMDPRLVEQFAAEAAEPIRRQMADTPNLVLLTVPEARPYLRMITERMRSHRFPSFRMSKSPAPVEVEVARKHLVTDLTPATILAVFAIFCRVGACLMIAPGFGSNQVPQRIRLFIALGASLAVAPLLLDSVRPAIGDGSIGRLVPIIFSELTIGLLFGFLARLFFLALEFITAFMTQAVGLSALPGTVVVDDDGQLPTLSTLYTVVASLTLMFVAGLHRELLRGLIDLYSTVPPGHPFDPQSALVDIADHAGAIFATALRIGSPFIVFSVVVNFAVGVTNKLTPTVPVFFIATPFIIFAGLFLLLFTAQDFFSYFVASFGDWLNNG